jgi:cation diffusion facilitator CzcD-associated flavoprotein CzcO
VTTEGTGARNALRVAVIGAGMGGILAVIKLREAGHDDITVFEKADRVGGTWRENTYPGIACDVPSHLYSYSFAPNPDWSHVFSAGEEIQAYFERVAAEYDVTRSVRFGDEVVAAEYGDGRWHLRTASGSEADFDVVVAATGVLHHPAIPELPGMADFEGACFHSARWDHSVPLAGARVGVVGTGSTAVQITSALARDVAHLTLFQRTAQWVLPQANPEYTEEEKARFHDDPELLRTAHDNLAIAFGGFAAAVIDADSPGMAVIESMCRDNLESVKDPALRERLRPDYRAGCKRLVVSPDFYEAIQSPTASLVTDRIDRFESGGVRTADGELHELDVVVLATGFRADAFMRPMAVTGRGGVALADAWRDRPNAYLSVGIPDFPNFFMINGPNGPVGNFSLIEVAEYQMGYVLQLIRLLATGGASEVAPTREATDRHEAERAEAAQHSIWVTGCRSWYLDDRGVPATWPWTFDRFREVMARPDLDCYELC